MEPYFGAGLPVFDAEKGEEEADEDVLRARSGLPVKISSEALRLLSLGGISLVGRKLDLLLLLLPLLYEDGELRMGRAEAARRGAAGRSGRESLLTRGRAADPVGAREGVGVAAAGAAAGAGVAKERRERADLLA